MRRVHLRGRTNILKRLVVHAGAANLGLLMRTVFGVGTPKTLQGRLRAAFSVIASTKRVLQLLWTLRMSEYRQRCRWFASYAPTADVSAAA